MSNLFDTFILRVRADCWFQDREEVKALEIGVETIVVRICVCYHGTDAQKRRALEIRGRHLTLHHRHRRSLGLGSLTSVMTATTTQSPRKRRTSGGIMSSSSGKVG